MADTFIEVVKFEATGLDKISTGLKGAAAQQKLLTLSTQEYSKALKASSQAFSTMSRSAGSVEFRRRVRETDELSRAQERFNRQLERQTAIVRYGQLGGNAVYAASRMSGIGGMAGAAASAGLAAGVSGLSGTVPMARFKQQMDRFTYELGNTLTPFVDILTKKLSKANNWLAKQDDATQDMIGSGLVGGAALYAGSKMGLGRIALGALGAAGSGLGYLGGAARMTGLSTLASANMAYGMGGMRGLAGLAGGGLAAAGVLSAIPAAANTFRSKYNIEENEALNYNAGGRKGTEGYADEYGKKFSGLSAEAKREAARVSLAIEMTNERAAISKMKGGKETWLGQTWAIATGGAGGTAALNEAQARQAVLRDIMAGKEVGSSHRANALVGGDWGEIGSGYYAAASEFGKTGGVTEGETGKELVGIVSVIADLVKEATNRQANPLN